MLVHTGDATGPSRRIWLLPCASNSPDVRIRRREETGGAHHSGDWMMAVRQAIEDDPDQPDRALLSRLLDDALTLEDGAAAAERLRQKASDLRAATYQLAAVTAAGDQVRATTSRTLPIVRGMADDIQEKTARLADLEARHAPSDAIAALRAEVAASMADIRATVLGAHPDRWSDESLTAWLPRYLDSNEAKLKNSKHLDNLRPRIELFARTVGDLPVRDYTREHFESYRDLLDRTPARWQARFKTDTLTNAIEGNGKLRAPFDPMVPKSVDDDYLSPLKTFFTWLADDRSAVERKPGREPSRPGRTRNWASLKPPLLSRFVIPSADRDREDGMRGQPGIRWRS